MKENSETLNTAEEVKESWEATLESGINIVPFVDIYENDDEFVLVANMPGVEKENVHIKLEEGSLYIFGKQDYLSGFERKYVLKETNPGNFYRKFNLSDGIDDSRINAAYENGQLKVLLPKHERMKPKNIEVK